MVIKRTPQKSVNKPSSGKLSDEDVYHMIMLHTYQRKSCSEIAKLFGISSGKAHDIIAKRKNSGCCG